MDSSSSGSSTMQNSGSEENLQTTVMDQRKRKRMISNRESARRSRMRKQKLLDDLTAQVAQLRKENQQIVTSVSITTQHYLSVEAENSVLRAQADELQHRLESLNDIIGFLNNNNSLCSNPLVDSDQGDDFLMNPISMSMNMNMNMNMNMFYLNQPLMASVDALQH